jgi:hypothetical protein
MLILRGLSALFLGTSVIASAAPLISEDIAPAWRSRTRVPEVDIYNSSALAEFVDRYRARHVLQSRIQAQRIKLGSTIALARAEDTTAWGELQPRQDICPTSSTVCRGGDGNEGFACSGCSSCCSDGAGGFQCCEKGYHCCTAKNGAGSCCPSEGGLCGDEGCKLLP